MFLVRSLPTEKFGLLELAADPRLATNVMRLAERSWLIPALQEVLAAIPQDEVARRCELFPVARCGALPKMTPRWIGRVDKIQVQLHDRPAPLCSGADPDR